MTTNKLSHPALKIAFVIGGGALVALLLYRRVQPIESSNKVSDISSSRAAAVALPAMEPRVASTTPVSTTSAPADVPPSPTLSPTAEGETPLGVIREILRTRNESDPRLDQVLRQLSAQDKGMIRQMYRELPSEDRSGRGLLAFTIARGEISPQDMRFLRAVVQEKPCLSLVDCSRADQEIDVHNSHVDEVSLVYPQLASLYQLRRQAEKGTLDLSNEALRNDYMKLIQAARRHPADSVRRIAESIPL